MKQIVTLTINGTPVEDAIADNALLIDCLRETHHLTGAKKGCDGGACTVLVDGRLSAPQRAFHENLGTQCGFCTPGMILAAQALLRRNPNPDVEQIRTALGGNLCRRTGYVKIIRSVQAAATQAAEA